MIKKWTLENFKSIADKTTLTMAPLTVFAGANSSGKSTVIQSILLVAQTLQSSVVSRPVVLNGHIVRLGAFDDVVFDGRPSENVVIGFELTPGDQGARPLITLAGYRGLPTRYYPRDFADSVTKVRCEFAFAAKGAPAEAEVLRLQPGLQQLRLTVQEREGTRPEEIELVLRRATLDAEARLRPFNLEVASQHMAAIDSLQYELAEPIRLGEGPRDARRRPRQQQGGTLMGATLTHFLPRALSEAYDQTEQLVRTVLDMLADRPYFRAHRYLADAPDGELKIPNVLKAAITQLLDQVADPTQGSRTQSRKRKVAVSRLKDEFTAAHVRRVLETLDGAQHEQFSSAVQDKYDELYRTAREERPSVWAIRAHALPETLDYGTEVILHHFTQAVKYLGPLRDEPKPVYPLAGGVDSRDIGNRGENTAAVLEVHRNASIEYIPSRQFSAESAVFAAEPATLLPAVLDWLEYLGIARDVKTVDLGKIGHQMQVTTADGGAFRDLIHVGVGVSQVLPIVVLSLLEEPNSTLIFEQPELHLHPRVQTRLADFFLSMSMLGKQCIVETHSEYLINQLRYRAALAEDDRVSQNVIVYFVEKRQGHSVFRTITINEYGVIENWPAGFFDENEENAARILKAGFEKRKRLSGKHA